MIEYAPRWPCPVCLGATMEKVAIGGARDLILDHCPRCGGIWFEYGEVPLLRERGPSALWARMPRRDGISRAQCHACHALIVRDSDRCGACGHRTRFHCPACQQPMEPVRLGERTFDVCKRCRGVWFDHHELAAVWDHEKHNALERRLGQDASARESAGGSVVLLDAMAYSPDVVWFGAHAAGHVVDASVAGMAHAPQAIGAAAEVAAEAATSVFDVILEIVAGFFS
jgi:hypothetical protein